MPDIREIVQVRRQANGGVSIGAGYQGTAAPANGLIVEGNVGLQNTPPGSLFDAQGNHHAIVGVFNYLAAAAPIFQVNFNANFGGIIIEIVYNILVPGVLNYSGIIEFYEYGNTTVGTLLDQGNAGVSKPIIAFGGGQVQIQTGTYVATIAPGQNNTIFYAARCIIVGPNSINFTITQF